MTLVPMPAPESTRISWPEAMERGNELAEIIANTDFVPRALRGNPPAILAAILYGHEIGLEPMQSLSTIAVIDGRPTLSAEAMRSLILRDGHEIWIEEATTSRATVAGRRRDGKTTSKVTWTSDDAKRARLAGRPAYQAYPRQMFVARATAELARQMFADVIRGYAATEELADVVEGEPADDQAGEGGKTTTRRRRRPAAPASNPTPETPDPPLEPPPAEVVGEVVGDDAPTPTSPEPPIETIAGPEPFTPAPDDIDPDEAAELAELEAGVDEPAPPDPPNPAALRKMFALFGEKGPHEREARLRYCEQAVSRKIGSSTELSALDVTRIIEALESGIELDDSADSSPATRPGTAVAGGLPPDEQALVDEARDLFGAREAGEPPLEH